MRAIISGLIDLGGFLAIIAIVWVFFGETTVTATLNGQFFNDAEVRIDGVLVGHAPYKARLWPGTYEIEVDAPAGSNVAAPLKWEKRQELFVGDQIIVPFTTAR